MTAPAHAPAHDDDDRYLGCWTRTTATPKGGIETFEVLSYDIPSDSYRFRWLAHHHPDIRIGVERPGPSWENLKRRIHFEWTKTDPVGPPQTSLTESHLLPCNYRPCVRDTYPCIVTAMTNATDAADFDRYLGAWRSSARDDSYIVVTSVVDERHYNFYWSNDPVDLVEAGGRLASDFEALRHQIDKGQWVPTSVAPTPTDLEQHTP